MKKVTFVGWLASIFEYWRGGLVYRFTFAKNAFYSGRLRVSFVPQGTDLTGAGYDFNQCRNWVLDLSGNSFEITVPWVYNYPWAKADPGAYTAVQANSSTGILFVTVLNELKAPSTVPSTIDLNLWLSGAEDIEFAIPSAVETFSSLGFVAPTAIVEAQVDDSDSGLADHDEQVRPSTNPILESTVRDFSVNPAAMCIGERVTNLRTIIKRFTMNSQFTVAADADTPALTLVPQQFYTSSGNASRNLLTNIAQIYRFYKGGMRYKVWYHHPQAYSGTTTEPLMGAVMPQMTDAFLTAGTTFAWDSTDHTNNHFMHWQNPMLNQVMEIQVPWYNTNPCAVICDDDVMVHQFQPRVFIMATGAVDQKLTLYSAAADDFSFGYLVGPPGVIYNPTATIAL
jgi:hypothetical protein